MKNKEKTVEELYKEVEEEINYFSTASTRVKKIFEAYVLTKMRQAYEKGRDDGLNYVEPSIGNYDWIRKCDTSKWL